MEEILTSLSELIRTLSRLNNRNEGLLYQGDKDRLERAKEVLRKNSSINTKDIIKRS